MYPQKKAMLDCYEANHPDNEMPVFHPEPSLSKPADVMDWRLDIQKKQYNNHPLKGMADNIHSLLRP